MHTFSQDLQYALRMLRKNFLLTAVIVVSLAIGIGANSAIFSVVDAVLLKPLPFRDPARLLVIWEKNPAQNKFRLFVSQGNFREWQQSQSFEGMSAVQDFRINLTGGPNGHKLVELTDGNGTSNILIVWDHAKTPGCANSKTAAPRGPWTPYADAAAQTHYPLRHLRVFNTLFCDAHVTSMTQAELHDSLFYAFRP